jgi:SAM-dependent methyltransferase
MTSSWRRPLDRWPYDRAVTSDQASDQHEHWVRTFAAKQDFLGSEPSETGRAARSAFLAASAREIVELGPGQGRDSLLFATAGLKVTALDYAETGLAQIREKAQSAGFAGSITTVVADVREPLPLATAAVDGVYAHMLLCMALSTHQVVSLVAEVHRVLRPGGLFYYTARNTSDAHFGTGSAHGDDQFEMGGFIVHFFGLELIERLADGFKNLEVADFEEERLPRRLSAVTMARI